MQSCLPCRPWAANDAASAGLRGRTLGRSQLQVATARDGSRNDDFAKDVILDMDGECQSPTSALPIPADKMMAQSLSMVPATGDLQAANRNADDEGDENPLSWLGAYQGKSVSWTQFFPIVQWVPAYIRAVQGKSTEQDLKTIGNLPYSVKGDAIAGLTVGVMLVPQCLAFAMLAGLPIQAGLYASFAPLVAYTCFGTIRQVQVGPTALVSLLTGQALDGMGLKSPEERLAGAALMALIVGLLSVLLGLIRFGFIVDFMSHSVMTAFCTAAGITIGTSQLKYMFGIKMPRQKHWWETALHLVTHLGHMKFPTLLLGGSLLGLLLTLKYWKSAGNIEKRQNHAVWRYFPQDNATTSFKVLKFVADLSAFIAVVIGILWGRMYVALGVTSVDFVGDVDADGFALWIPGVDTFSKMSGSMFVAAAIVSVVGFLETVAVGGKFAAKAKYEYSPNQELLAIGIANIAGALMCAYPTTGSFTRTAVNAMLGATSLAACFLSSIVVVMAMLFLLPVIGLLPQACLAPIIIQGAIGVVDIHSFKVAYQASKTEFIVMVVTLVVSLALTVKEGLLCGFVCSVLKTMNDLANPNLAVCGQLKDGSWRDIRNFKKSKVLKNAVVVRIDARLSFANSRRMKEFCLRAVEVREEAGDAIEWVIVDCKPINHVDLTGCEMIEALADSLKDRGQRLILANVKGPVSKLLAKAEVPEYLKRKRGHLCVDIAHALAIVTNADGEGEEASKHVEELLRNQKEAKAVMKEAAQTPRKHAGKVPRRETSPVPPASATRHASFAPEVVGDTALGADGRE